MCSTSSDAAGAVEGDADGVEADLGVAGRRRGARPSRRWRGGGPGAACGGRPRGPGARGRSRSPARPALTSTKTSVAAVEGDDVELAVAGAGVALDDLPAGGGEAARRPGPRRPGPMLLAGVGHRGPRLGRAPRARWRADDRRRNCLTSGAPRVRRALPSVAAVLATARTFTLDGISARPVRVEVDVHRGLPAFSDRRPARRRGARGARAGAGGAGQLRLRVPAAADRRQPGAGQPAQGRARGWTWRSRRRC